MIPLALLNKAVHKQVLLLAIPMVLSNITVPLLGLVDAAVVGHLDHAWYLGGVALGSTVISVTFWLLGFLRMSTTGLTAQALGAGDNKKLSLVLVQGLSMALVMASVLLLVHGWLSDAIFKYSDASEQVKYYASQYFSIRVWSAPAALTNLVLLGWLLGTQNAKAPMWMVIIANVTNIGLDLLFVVGFHWQVKGAALASVIADYSSLIFALYCARGIWRAYQLPSPLSLLGEVMAGMSRFLRLNRDIFLRSLCLQAAFSFMTFRGAAFGDDVVAANAVLMSFLMVISYGMDGFAYAMEAMVGKAIGANSRSQLVDSLLGTFFWSALICVALTVAFALAGGGLISFVTDIQHVQSTALQYLPWLVMMPLISMWCFLFDGIFIGATKGREMRNSMFLAMCSFFLVFYTFQSLGNHALWLAMLSFMAVRGATLAVVFTRQWQRDTFLVPAAKNSTIG